MTAYYLWIGMLFVILTACHSTSQKTTENSGAILDSNTTTATIDNDSYSCKTFMVGNDWGYDIYKDNHLLIHQPNIPAIAGNRGFFSEQKAISVAQLTIQKLRNGIMPPTISVEELDSLKAME